MKIFLTGFMGSGKTTYGKIIAKELNFEFIDMDDYIEEAQGQTIADIFKTKGETEFRVIEKSILHKITGLQNIVVATGGGTPCFFNNMDVINQNGISVYLKGEVEFLFKMLVDGREHRPLLKGKTNEELITFIAEKLASREEYYNKAQLKVNPATFEIKKFISLVESVNKRA